MKKIPAIIAVAACSILAITAPAARADANYGPITVSVWTGTGVTDQASLPLPGGSANFIFTYTGPLDFATSNPANSFADFFGSNVSYMSNFTQGTESALLADIMSTPGETAPGSINSYLSFVGSYTAGSPTLLTIQHDDGASLYLNGSSTAVAGLYSPSPTSEIPSTGTVPGGTNAFDLVYVESNGAPSDLIVTGLDPTPTPEPGSIGLMALGMISLAAVAYRGGAFNA